jgi:hypothetical protein
MQDNAGDKLFGILIGEKLSSITFVMDYLQIDFDGNCFTFNIWPIITVDGIEYKFGEPHHRNKLCSLIAKIVSEVILVDKEKFVINFDYNNNIYLSLDPNNPSITIPEIAHFTDTNGNCVVF